MISKITDKYQITIPKKIREKLKLLKHDTVEWEIKRDKIYMRQIKKPFLQYRGALKVGAGNIDNDIKKAIKTVSKKNK